MSLPNNSKDQPSFLFLQGPPSLFAKKIGKILRDKGYQVRRINFCLGDWVYWNDDCSFNFTGRASEWPEYIEKFIKQENITHIVYFADRLPYHRVAASVARKLGVKDVSYEFGYLRPDWIVMERGGQSTYSHFPDSISEIEKIAETMPTANYEKQYGFSFIVEAFNEVVFNLLNFFDCFFFRYYHTDRYYNPIHEYLSYIRRLIAEKFYSQKAIALQEKLIRENIRYFVVPLQMQGDYQIRNNSAETEIGDIIASILKSFSKSNQKGHLVFKLHPLDNGIRNWEKEAGKVIKSHALQDRVHFIDGGDLFRLTKRAAGMVTVNSTSGIHALQLGTPVKVLGISVYDIEGVTHTGPLDDFWHNPFKPKAAQVDALINALANGIHFKGDFYSSTGQAAGAAAMAERLLNESINQYGTFIDPPPRIQKAKDQGIDVCYP